MEARATYDFKATAEGELSFGKGQQIKILNTVDENWYLAEFNGSIGRVPENYLNYSIPHWYHGKISREKAEEFLMQPEQTSGAFLIRDSESSPGDFTLSVKIDQSVEHLKILRDGAGKYFLWLVKFDSLNSLIQYHRSSSVTRDQNVVLKDMEELTCYVKAAYGFEATGIDEIGFKKGDIIKVIEKVDSNWWKGELNDKSGLFPVNYVEEL